MWRKRLDSLPDTIDCTLLNNQFKENKEVYCIVGASNRNILAVISSSEHKGTTLFGILIFKLFISISIVTFNVTLL